MTTRINGGIVAGKEWMGGDLNHFLVDVEYNLITNFGDPRSAAELIVEHISTRATPVIIGPVVQTVAAATGVNARWGFSFAVEMADALDPNNVQTALAAITSVPDGPDATADLSTLTIVEQTYDFS